MGLPCFCAIAASVVLLCIRGTAWDYYYLDIAVFAYFGVRAQSRVEATGRDQLAAPEAARAGPFLSWAALGFMLVIHGSVLGVAKRHVDNAHAVTELCERAFRAGKIGPSEIGIAPFGYLGWHMYPYFITHEGSGGAYIAEFQGYLRPDALRLQTRSARDRNPLADPESILASDVFTIRWFEHHEFILRATASAERPPLALNAASYRVTPFPLSDSEWSEVSRHPPM
jgi:hypothetical protein